MAEPASLRPRHSPSPSLPAAYVLQQASERKSVNFPDAIEQARHFERQSLVHQHVHEDPPLTPASALQSQAATTGSRSALKQSSVQQHQEQVRLAEARQKAIEQQAFERQQQLLKQRQAEEANSTQPKAFTNRIVERAKPKPTTSQLDLSLEMSSVMSLLALFTLHPHLAVASYS